MSDIILTAYNGAILGPVARLLGLIMNAIYSFMTNVLGIGNITVAIIIFTIVIYTQIGRASCRERVSKSV